MSHPPPPPPPHVAFIGLGAMGFGMATHLVRQGFAVTGFDVWPPTLARFAAAVDKITTTTTATTATTATTPAAAVAGCSVCVCMVATAAQVQTVLVDGPDAAARALPRGAVVLLCSTVSSGFVQGLGRQLADGPVWCCRPDLLLVDAPVSGGAARAADGTLSIMAGASPEALAHVDGRAVLASLASSSSSSSSPQRLYTIAGGLGAGSNAKMVHQVLAANQILAAAEAVGLASRMLGLGLDDRLLDDLLASPGASWMLGHRGPRMLAGFRPVASALHIVVKDVAIITSEARRVRFPVLLTSVAENTYLDAIARGWGLDDDSALLRLYTASSRSASPGAVSPESAVASAAAASPESPESPESPSPLHLVVALLKGIHLVAAAESLAFAHRLGLDLDLILGLCIDAAGGSAMLAAHGPLIVSVLRSGTVAVATAAITTNLDSLDSVFHDLTAAIHAAQLLKASVYLGTQALNILSLARRQIAGDTSNVPAGAVVKVWMS